VGHPGGLETKIRAGANRVKAVETMCVPGLALDGKFRGVEVVAFVFDSLQGPGVDFNRAVEVFLEQRFFPHCSHS
jgi:hypothetical protein